MFDPFSSHPLVWLTRQLSRDLVSHEELTKDCDCAGGACPPLASSVLETRKPQVEEGSRGLFSLDHEAYTDRLDNYTIALGAVGQSVVVLNEVASHLLTLLARPRTLEDIATQLRWPHIELTSVLNLLLGNNILLATGSCASAQPATSADTLRTWLHLTNRCNLACEYCYIRHSPVEMSVDVAQRAVDAAFRSALRHGYRRVQLKYAGGEPTLNFPVLLAAQEHAERQSQRTGIELESILLTNGLSIDERQIAELQDHRIGVVVSLDGVGQYQDAQRPQSGGSSFAAVDRCLSQLLSSGLKPKVTVTITARSAPGLPDLVEYLLDRDLRFSLNFYRPPDVEDGAAELADTFAKILEGLEAAFASIERRLPTYCLLSCLADRGDLRTPHVRTCGVGHDYMVVDCLGYIHKCQMDMLSPVAITGAEDPLDAIRIDRHGIQNLDVHQKECTDCIWRYRCTGGCPRLSFQFAGHYGARSPLCEVYRAILPKIIRLEARRLLQYEEPWDLSAN